MINTNATLNRSRRFNGSAPAGSGIDANGVAANAGVWSAGGLGCFSIGRMRSRVLPARNTAAIAPKNNSADHNRPRPTDAAISQTGELKNTSTVSNTTGSARSINCPTNPNCDTASRVAQPSTEPSPVAVSSGTISRLSAVPATSVTPPNASLTSATAAATVEATNRARVLRSRDTSQ